MFVCHNLNRADGFLVTNPGGHHTAAFLDRDHARLLVELERAGVALDTFVRRGGVYEAGVG